MPAPEKPPQLWELRGLRATEPVAELPTRWFGIEPEGRTQKFLKIKPITASHDFRLTLRRSLRILGRTLLVGVMVIPVVDPFPGIAGHVVNAVGALAHFEHSYRNQGHMVRPFLLAEIRMEPGGSLVAPGIEAAIRPSRRLFPLRLGRQTLAGPFAVRGGLRPADIDDGAFLMSRLVHDIPL